MKKFYILLIALFMLNRAMGQGSIPALSTDASIRSKHPTLNLQHRTLNSIENLQGIVGNKEWKTSDFFYEKKSREPINHRTPQQRSLIQIYDSIYNWVWDTISIGWTIDSKTINMVYDAKYNLTSQLEQSWNGSAWGNSEQYSYTYDAKNNLTSELRQSWNGSAWGNSEQYSYTYDAKNNRTSELRQSWNGSVWENSFLTTYTYDANSNRTSRLHQFWNDSAWVNISQVTYTYDANNNLTSELWQTWKSSIWENYWQYTYTYDANNNLTSFLLQTWNGSAWENWMLGTATYDANNNLTSALDQTWNGNAWENSEQYTYTYDADNNLTSILIQSWNGSAWVNSSLYTYTYDANNFEKSYSYKYWNDAGTKVTSGDSAYNYFHTNVGINDLMVQEGRIVVYPNPSSDRINIETSAKGSLSILNLNGKQLLQQEITEPSTTIDVNGLKSGVYVVKVVWKNWVQVGKFIKK